LEKQEKMGYLKFLPSLFSGRADYPLYLIFFITSKCTGRCHHCFYWRRTNAPENELNIEEIEKMCFSMGDLLQVFLTGGDSAEREDLPQIARLFADINHVLNITLVTNGWHSDRVEKQVLEVLQTCPKTNITVDLTIDGLDGLHDEIRGREGIFDHIVETGHRLMPFRKSFKNFNLCLNTTISSFNQHQLLQIYNWIKKEFDPAVYNAYLTRGEPRDMASLDYDLEPYEQLSEAMERDVLEGNIRGYSMMGDVLFAKDKIMRDLVLRIRRKDEYLLPCTAGKLTGVVYPEGKVHICELDPDPIGDLRAQNYDMRAIWTSPAMQTRLEEIRQTKCHCIHQCFLTNNILFNQKFWPQISAKVLRYKLHRLGRRLTGKATPADKNK
jgi:MoaA/NifB/PqqE/SkfB family radical SAM enzyme